MSPLTPGVRAQLRTLSAEFKANPADARANLNLAKALVAYESYIAAEGYLRRATILDSKDHQSAYLLGWVLAAQGDRESAVADFDRALKLKPGSLPANLARADALRRLGRNPEAEKSFRRILKDHPAQPHAQFGLGNVLLSTGSYGEAIAVLQDLCSANPRFGAAHYTLAEAHRKAGDRERAASQLAAYKASPTREPALDDEIIQGIKDLNRSHQGLYNRSLRVASSGDWKQAAQLLEEAVSEDPNFLVGHVNLVTCYAHLGDVKKTDEHYRRALALSPDSAELQNTRGLVDKVAGRNAEARKYFLRAIETDPNHYTSYENLGQISFEAGDLASALRSYEKSAAIAPHSSRSWIMLGTIHLKQKRQEQARDAFLQVLRLGPDAEPAIQSVMSAYKAADEGLGWNAFARAAIDRAKQLGLTTIQLQLAMAIR